MSDDLVMESTSDTPEQIREGMGLPKVDPAPAPAAESPAAPAADAAADTTTTAPAAAAEAVAEPPATETETAVGEEASTQARGPDGKFVAAPKRKPVAAQPRIDELTREKNEERAQRLALEAERDALKRRLDELAAGQPAPKPAAAEPTIAPEDFRSPVITAQFQTRRAALGAEPKQEDFEDFTEFRRAERAYDRKHAALDAEETFAHQRAAERASIAAQDATRAAQQRFTTYNERVAAAKARHADYDQVMQAGMAIPFKGRPYADDIQQAILDSEQGPEIVYHLASHPEELARLQALPSVHAAMVELGTIAAAIRAQPPANAPAGATQTGPTTAVTPPATQASRPPSRAPEPQGTALGGSTTTAPLKLDDPNISQAEYNRRRDAEIRARRGR
jgi:hypothetical protein